MYEIKILSPAQKDLDKLRGSDFERIKDKIFPLKNNPRPTNSIKLSAQEGYRIRMGDYRVLYRIEDKERVVFIYRVKHRKEAYR